MSNVKYDSQFIFGTFIVGILFPIILTVGMHISSNYLNEKQADLKRKEELLTNFTQSFSQFSSLAGDYYYYECLGINNLPVEDVCKGNSKENEKSCQKMKVKMRLLHTPQPEGILSQLIVFYDSPEVKKDAEILFEKQKEIFNSLGCNTLQREDFDKLITSVDQPYNRMVRNMAKELKQK